MKIIYMLLLWPTHGRLVFIVERFELNWFVLFGTVLYKYVLIACFGFVFLLNIRTKLFLKYTVRVSIFNT